jgi:hypothetical protein
MKFKKLVNLKTDQKDGLDDIQRQVNENGGNVSLMTLINDSIDVFIDSYSDAAIKRYSNTYYEKKDKSGDD